MNPSMALTELGLLDLTETAGCACKVDSRDLGILRDRLNLKIEHLGLQDAGSHTFSIGRRKARFGGSIDFIGPIARTPEDYGIIAALHALSDLWASGVRPRVALVVAIWPRDSSLWPQLIEAVAAMQHACERVKCEILGGHTAYGDPPFLGLSVFGEKLKVSPKPAMQPGDHILVTKPLGVGIAIGAVKEGECPPETERDALAVMKTPNTDGLELNRNPMIKIVSDITGFGLVGQLAELVKQTGLKVKLDKPLIPVVDGAQELARIGHGSSAAERNWQEYRPLIAGSTTIEMLRLLCDPQTNGPLMFVADQDIRSHSPRMREYHHIGHLIDPTDVSDDSRTGSIF